MGGGGREVISMTANEVKLKLVTFCQQEVVPNEVRVYGCTIYAKPGNDSKWAYSGPSRVNSPYVLS